MRKDFYYDSKGEGKIYACAWYPEGEPVAVVQIVHGIAEHIDRYADFAAYLNTLGILVVAEDHMGHGASMETGTQGYFAGGWFTAVADTYALLEQTRKEYPGLPYVLFGHSMGSFMARTILAKYPESGISGAIICGTGWMPEVVLKAGRLACRTTAKLKGSRTPSAAMQNLAFGGYLKRVDHPRTPYDWLSRDDKVVDAYAADPRCGFIPAASLLADMMEGLLYIQRTDSLKAMKKTLPVLFIAGGDDPVGDYGNGVQKAAKAFREAGMEQVGCKLYPLCRHEILNEINKEEIYADIGNWLREQLKV